MTYYFEKIVVVNVEISALYYCYSFANKAIKTMLVSVTAFS